MKEVSCKAFDILFKALEENKHPVEIICRNIPYDLDYLRNQKNNVEWDVFCKAFSNTREVYNDDDYIRLGIQIIEWKVYPVVSVMLGFFLNSKEMYRLLTSSKNGMSSQMFRCLTTTFKEINKNNIEILGELPEGYRYSTEFFLISKGVFIAAPMLLKQKPAHVVMEETDRGALYKISLPPRSSPFIRLRQFLSLPSSRVAAVRELNESYELLYERNSELEESKVAIQKHEMERVAERARISRDLHDEIGSDISKIALLSEVVRQNPIDKQSKANIEKIISSANEALEHMSEIVWSMNPKNDKLENLISYIRKFAIEYFEPTNITCKVNMPDEIPNSEMKGEQRRNVFLSVKEALHNVQKHSGASLVELSFVKKDKHGEIIIHDNGKGIDKDQLNRFGNGLQNMKQRMQSAGGYFAIENKEGTTVWLGYQLT